MSERRAALEREIAELAARPAAIAAAGETLGAEFAAAAQHRRQAADRLALDEARLREAAQRSRLAIDSLARLDGQSEGAGEALARPACAPEDGTVCGRRRF